MVERRCRSERGSTLLLFPAGVMVLLVLAAIAIDLSSVHLARRELLRTASQAADDASALLDPQAVRRGDLHTVDHSTAERLVRFELSAATLPGRLDGPPRIDIDPSTGAVTVETSMTIERVFGRVVPGMGDSQQITVRVRGALIDVE